MRKRVICFLAAAILMLLPLFSPALAGCTHEDENGRPLGIYYTDYVAPQIGVPGYSGDKRCSACHAVLERGHTLPALEAPIGPSDGKPPSEQENPAEPVIPGQPDPPVQPVTPGRETPAEPVIPDQPDPPVQPANPGRENPADPVIPDQPEPPVKPGEPVLPVSPAEPENPAQPEAPVITEPAAGSGQPAAPAGSGEEEAGEKPASFGEPAQEAENPAAPPAQRENETVNSGTGSGPDGSALKKRPPFSGMYPYRRIRMAPEKGVRAEAAGVLIWPAPSPIQGLFGN